MVKEKKLKILIPLLSRQEFNEEFLEKAVGEASEVVLLLVIDTNALTNEFGFATSEIRQGNQLLEQIKSILKSKQKRFTEITEWGDTLTKIDHIAQLQKADKIVLQKQENHYWKELVKKLKQNSKKEIEIIAVKPKIIEAPQTTTDKAKEKAKQLFGSIKDLRTDRFKFK